MPELRPEQVSANWNAVGRNYAADLGHRFGPYVEEALRLSPVGEGSRVLDVATGPGTLALAAAKAGAQVVAADFSSVMVEQVAARAAAEGVSGRLEARVMDGQALALPDGAFDAAFSMFGLMVFPDRAAGFKELHRVLKDGGRGLVATWDKPPRNEWLSFFQQALRTALPDVPPPPPPLFMELADPARLKGEMEAAGFQDVEVVAVDRTLDFGPPEGLWGVLMETNPALPGMVARLGDDRVGAVKAALGGIAGERAKGDAGGRVMLRVAAWMVVGRK